MQQQNKNSFNGFRNKPSVVNQISTQPFAWVLRQNKYVKCQSFDFGRKLVKKIGLGWVEVELGLWQF